eukprot:c16213_g1_i3.p1 GENE.c16213_g1_i3~~c16213_g1_i3.p1  ORF type:complete len:383 (-),score=86.83 c16213_g1_i3:319-1467(-)
MKAVQLVVLSILLIHKCCASTSPSNECEHAVRAARSVSPFLDQHLEDNHALCSNVNSPPETQRKSLPRGPPKRTKIRNSLFETSRTEKVVSSDTPDHSNRIFEKLTSHVTSFLEVDDMPGVGGGGIGMVICALACQIPENRDCMIPCLKHVRCVGLLADPVKAMGMLEFASVTVPISSSDRESASRTFEQENLESVNDAPIELGDDRLDDYNTPSDIPETSPTNQNLESQNLVQAGMNPVSGIDSGMGGVKSGAGPALPLALALFFSVILGLVMKFLAMFLEMFVKFRCMLGFYMPEQFMMGMCGWRCVGKALCIFRCLDTFSCCDLFQCTLEKFKQFGMNPMDNLSKIPKVLTDCSDRDCRTSTFGCASNGKHFPMFGQVD